MPSLSLYSPTQNGCSYDVSSLSSAWNSTNYNRMVISSGSTTSGSTSAPSGIVVTRYPPTTGSNYTISGTISGLSSGSYYYFYAYMVDKYDRYWLAGSDYIYTQNPPQPVLPGAPTNISHLVNGLTVTVYFTKGTNASYTELDKYDGSSYLTTTGTSFTYSMPNYNTTYYYDMRSVNSDGTSSWTPQRSFTTGSPPAPATPSAPTLYLGNEDYRYEGGFRIQWGSVTGATKYKIKLKVNGQSDASAIYYETTSTNYTFSSDTLGYGVSYNLTVCAVNSSNIESSYSGATILTTRPKKPTLSISSTSNSISVVVSGLTGNYDSAYVYLRDANGNGIDTIILSSNGQTALFEGLIAGTNYQIDARTYLSVSGTFLFSFYTVRQTIKTSNRPINWQWTTQEINDFNNKGQTTTLTYLRWNTFIDKVNEFRAYKNLALIGGKMTSNDKKLYANSFRIVAQGIRDMTTSLNSSLTTVVINDMVYGWYLNHIAVALEYIV